MGLYIGFACTLIGFYYDVLKTGKSYGVGLQVCLQDLDMGPLYMLQSPVFLCLVLLANFAASVDPYLWL